MASEEWNCLSQYKRVITSKASPGIKKKEGGPEGGCLQADGNSVPGRRRRADN